MSKPIIIECLATLEPDRIITPGIYEVSYLDENTTYRHSLFACQFEDTLSTLKDKFYYPFIIKIEKVRDFARMSHSEH